MRTLEEIYTDNTYQIAEQLNKKIQLFLGSMNTFKKQIKKMYDVRSRFLHGNTNLAPYHKKNYIDYPNSYDNEIYEASTLGLILIISTLQKMFNENRLDINFEYILN